MYRVKYRLQVGAEFGIAEDRAIGVDGRVPPVGRGQIMQIVLWVEPVAHRDHEVALNPDWARWAASWQLSSLDAIGPIRERREVTTIRRHNLGDEVEHVMSGGPDGKPLRPGIARGIELTKGRRNVPRGIVADLVAIAAAVGLDKVEPLLLGLEVLRDAIAGVPGSGEAALIRHADHRGPVNCRVVLRCRGEARRN